jgi:hypothetical protein
VGLAEFERDLIRARTGEGRERAKARGVKMGRKPKLTPHQQAEQTEAHPSPASGGDQAARCRRTNPGDRPQLQRPQQHDFTVNGMIVNLVYVVFIDIGRDNSCDSMVLS